MSVERQERARKILVVDDDPSFLTICRAILTKNGYTVITASDGTTGLTRARQERPDAIILDYMMATPNEGSLIAWLSREDPDLCAIPVVMATAVGKEHPWWNVQPDEEELPVDAWLDKPVSPDQLLAELDRLLSRPARTT